ncbi:MAG: orotate phosphoribosyltransferase [Actinomycetota bacterium]
MSSSMPATGDLGSDREQRLTQLGRDLVEVAYLTGDFVLSSGVRSNYYLDKYQFETRPDILRRLATFLAELLPADTDRIAGPELGAVPLATALSLETGLPFVIARRDAKAYSTGKAVEGEIHPGERISVVEDVISSGTQSISAADRIAATGAHVLGILAVVDREQGGREAIAAAGYSLTALFTRRQLGI